MARKKKTELDTIMEDHRPNLEGMSDTVKERFSMVDELAEANDDYIVLLDNMEKALIGTMTNEHGVTVAVYERELCIRCLMESYGPDWAKTMGCYTKKQMADEAFMEEELYTTAVEDFEYNTLRALPYQHEHAPVIVDGFFVDSERWSQFKEA